jgi:Asp/Glu/hydantoin racemase
MIKVVAVHTAMALVEPLNQLFREHLPQVKLNHIADDSLIQEVIANNRVTPAVRRRLLAYYQAAVESGADFIFNCCSSVGDVADLGRSIVSIPVFRIDYPMAVQAVTRGKRIGVIATLPTTLGPTKRLLSRLAEESGKEIVLVDGLASGAFQAAQSGDSATHDRLIREVAEKISDQVELIVLAQGSMARMEKALVEITKKPVFSSPLSGVLGLKEYLLDKGLIE